MCTEETVASSCLWAFSVISTLQNPLIEIAKKTISLVHAFQTDFWIFSFGFLGFWGMKKNKNKNEKINENENLKNSDEKIKNSNGNKNENENNIIEINNKNNCDLNILQIALLFLESKSVNNFDGFVESEIILCFLSLYIYIYNLTNLNNNELRARTLQLLSVQLNKLSLISRGNISLYWTNALLPIFKNKIGIGKTIKNKIKSFQNNENNSNNNGNGFKTVNYNLSDLFDWISVTPGLCGVIVDSMKELVQDSIDENIEINDEENLNENENPQESENKKEIENGKVILENTTVNTEIKTVTPGKKRKSNVAEIEEENEEENEVENEEEGIEMGSYEIDVQGDRENIPTLSEEHSEVRSTFIFLLFYF